MYHLDISRVNPYKSLYPIMRRNSIRASRVSKTMYHLYISRVNTYKSPYPIMRQNLIRRLPCMIYHLDIFQSNTYKSPHTILGQFTRFKVPYFCLGSPFLLEVNILIQIPFSWGSPYFSRFPIYVQGVHFCSGSEFLFKKSPFTLSNKRSPF